MQRAPFPICIQPRNDPHGRNDPQPPAIQYNRTRRTVRNDQHGGYN